MEGMTVVYLETHFNGHEIQNAGVVNGIRLYFSSGNIGIKYSTIWNCKIMANRYFGRR